MRDRYGRIPCLRKWRPFLFFLIIFFCKTIHGIQLEKPGQERSDENIPQEENETAGQKTTTIPKQSAGFTANTEGEIYLIIEY